MIWKNLYVNVHIFKHSVFQPEIAFNLGKSGLVDSLRWNSLTVDDTRIEVKQQYYGECDF